MPDTLRDLVVNLSLESDNFSKNIKAINSQIRETESEFKAAGAGVADFESTLGGAQAKAEMLEKKLALQSKAVEQYEKALSAAESKLQSSYQKHEELSKALEEAKGRYTELVAAEGENSDAAKAQAAEIAKLEGQLKSVDKQMQTNANAVTTATTNLNNARGAIASTEAELNSVNAEIAKQSSAWQGASDALNEFSEKANAMGDKLTGVGKKLTVGLTTPIVAIGTASVKAFNEVDEGLDTIITKTGASGQALEELNAIYERLYGSMPITASEAGVAVGEVSTRFGLTGETLEKVSREFLQFANINGVDLNGAIDSVDAAMTKFGVDTSEVGNVLGYITKVGQDTGISTSSLISSLNSNGAVLRELGLGLDESITLLAQFEANGVNASTALMGFKQAVGNAAKDGKTASEAFRETANAIKNAKTETEAMAIATELFGARSAAEMVSAIRDGRLSLDELSVAMENYASTVSDTYEATQDLTDSVKTAYNRLKIIGKGLAESLFTAVEPAVTSLLTSLQGLVDKFNEMDAASKDRIVKIAAIVAAVGPVVTVIGKITPILGAVTGALGKFTGAVASAGGGIKGLGAVLTSSPALWLALAAAVAYGTYKLIDYASGAKAAREALERMNKAAEDWKNNSANTFYTSSKGLDAFGISSDAFRKQATDGEKWLNRLREEWSDALFESDETVNNYVSSFKELTNSTRQSLIDLASEAYDNGYTSVYDDLNAQIAELDSIDQQVAELLQKRKESYLSAEDIAELNALISRREEIEVKYHLVEADPGSGFDQIVESVKNAEARAAALGQETEISVYQDALVASAQGLKEMNASIDEQYDSRLKLIGLIEDQAEKEKEQAALDEWYRQERQNAADQYADTVKQSLGMVGESEGIKQTAQTINDLYNTIDRYNSGEASLSELSAFTESLNEDDIAEYYSYMTQLYDLLDKGFSMDDIAEMTGLDTGTLEGAFYRLEGIMEELGKLDMHKELDPLREMFGQSLSEEVLKIATDLDLTGAQERWKEFAENPGAAVFTEGWISGYTVDPNATTENIKPHITGTITSITGNSKALDVKDYSINPFTGVMTVITGNGETITATDYSIDPITGTINAATPEGDTITITGTYTAPVTGTLTSAVGTEKSIAVTAYTLDPLTGTMSYVTGNGETITATDYAIDPITGTISAVTPSGDTIKIIGDYTAYAKGTLSSVDGAGKTFTVANATVNASGTLVMITPDGEQIEANGYTLNVDGTITGVTTNGETFTLAAGTVTATAKVEAIGDIGEAAITEWKRRNAGNVKLTANVNANVKAVFGEDSKVTLSDLADAGLLQLYDADGVKIPVTAKAAGSISASDLVIGTSTDEEGHTVYHVQVLPEWVGSASEDAEQTVQQVGEAVERASEGLSGKIARAAEANALNNGKWGDLGIDHTNFGSLGYLFEGLSWGNNAVGQALKWMGLLSDSAGATEEEINDLAGAVSGVSYTYENGIAPLNSYGEEVEDFLRQTGDLINEVNESGGDSGIVSTMLDELAQYGVSLTQSDLPQYLYDLAGAIHAESAAEKGAEWMATALGSGEVSGRGKDIYEGRMNNGKDGLVGRFREIADLADSGGLNEARAQYEALLQTANETMDADQLAAFQGQFEALKEYLDSFGNEVVPAAAENSANASAFEQAGEQNAGGFAAGFDAGTPLVVAAAQRMAQTALETVKKALGIASPSRVFRDEVGAMAMAGFGEGVEMETRQQGRIIRNAARYLTDEAQFAVAGSYSSATNNYNTTNAPISFEGASFNIREQSDIYALAREIAALTKRQNAGRGAR